MKLTRFVESAAPSLVLAIAVMVAIAPSSSGAVAGQLWVGGATVDITPDGPVALAGQRHLRIASKVESPVTATAPAVETRDGNESIDHAVFVSCDLVAIREGIAEMLREKLKDVLPELDPQKVVLSIAHTQLWLGGNRCSDTLAGAITDVCSELWLGGNRCSDTLRRGERVSVHALWLGGNRCSDTLNQTVIP